jgi:hypothetical protein
VGRCLLASAGKQERIGEAPEVSARNLPPRLQVEEKLKMEKEEQAKQAERLEKFRRTLERAILRRAIADKGDKGAPVPLCAALGHAHASDFCAVMAAEARDQFIGLEPPPHDAKQQSAINRIYCDAQLAAAQAYSSKPRPGTKDTVDVLAMSDGLRAVRAGGREALGGSDRTPLRSGLGEKRRCATGGCCAVRSERRMALSPP